MELDILLLRKLCEDKRVIWSKHIVKRLEDRGIYRTDVLHVLETGTIIEQYPDSYPYPSCLIYGLLVNGEPLHIVVGTDGTILTFITTYQPSETKFESDHRTRKERE